MSFKLKTNMKDYSLEETVKGTKVRDKYSNHVIAEFKGVSIKDLKRKD